MLKLELLETRDCPSATLVEGVLQIEGTPAADYVHVSGLGDDVVVNDNGVVSTFARANITSIDFDGNGGTDRFVMVNVHDIHIDVNAGPGALTSLFMCNNNTAHVEGGGTINVIGSGNHVETGAGQFVVFLGAGGNTYDGRGGDGGDIIITIGQSNTIFTGPNDVLLVF